VPIFRSGRAFAATVALTCVGALAPATALGAGSGGIGPGGPPTETTTTPGSRAKLLPSGLAAAPADAPAEVQQAIAAANEIDNASYCSGGGHQRWKSRCYDCSGAVSYVLGPKGAGLLEAPLSSYEFNKWGDPGRGGWITVYYNGGHAFVMIAGLRFDTSIPDDGRSGPGWSKDVKAGMVNGPFRKRHFAGL
jgi:hypothetical protein